MRGLPERAGHVELDTVLDKPLFLLERLFELPYFRQQQLFTLVGLRYEKLQLSFRQTRRQLQRSDLWYGTQIRLMRWVEAELPADVGLVADGRSYKNETDFKKRRC